MEKGADPNAKDVYGFTPLHHAHYAQSAEDIKLLQAHGADPSIKDNKGRPPQSMPRDNLKVRPANAPPPVEKMPAQQ